MANNALKSFILILLIISSASSFAQKKNSEKWHPLKDSYERLWIKVDKLEKAGLSKSAKIVADSIYRKAKNENNQSQIIKSLLVKYSLKSAVEEDSAVSIIRGLKEEISSSKSPYKNILTSALAQIYMEYYRSNFYTIYKRSTINDTISQEDFTLWSKNYFQKEITKLFLQSLENSELLFQTYSADLPEIIGQYDEPFGLTKPTLLDILSFHALDFFMNAEYSSSVVPEKSQLDDPALLSDAGEFSKVKLSYPDSLSPKFNACRIFQMLNSYHLSTPSGNVNKRIIAEIDVMRLKFIHDNIILENRDSLLISTLKTSALNSHPDNVSAVYWLKLAQFYMNSVHSTTDLFPDKPGWKAGILGICDSLLKRIPDTKEAKQFKIIKETILKKGLTISLQSAVPADMPFNTLIDYRNIDTLFFSIVPVNTSNELLLKKKIKNLQKFYRKLKNVTAFFRTFKHENDYENHSAEITLPSLKTGRYVILIADNKDYIYKPDITIKQEFQVTNLSLITRKSNEQSELLVVNRTNGSPVENVRIEANEYNYKHNRGIYIDLPHSTLTTDKDGLAFLKDTKHSYELEMSKDGDKYEGILWADYYVKSKENDVKTRAALFTDRTIYRPGQKLYFKGILYEADKEKAASEVAADKQVTVTLYDANRQALKNLELKTNEFGSFSGEFDLPIGLLNGQWTISCGNRSAYFRVEEYKRPQFEVKIDPQKKDILLDDIVSVSGSAETFSGTELKNAVVNYTVVRSVEYFFSDYYERSYLPSKMISSGNLVTDSLGHFFFNFTASPDPSGHNKNIIYRFSVHVSITDNSGETQEADSEIRAGRQSIFLSSDISETQNAEIKKPFSISVTDVNARPAEAELKAVIYRLAQPEGILINRPWNKPDRNITGGSQPLWKLPDEGYLYIDEHPYSKWERKEIVFQKEMKVKGDSVIFPNNLKDWDPGKYVLVLTANGRSGAVSFEKYFDLFNPSSDGIPVNKPLWTAVVTPTVQPGTKAKIAAGTALNELNVLYEAENKNGIVFRKWITLKKGLSILTIPVEADAKSDLYVRLNAVHNNRAYSFSEKITVEKPERNLKITFESFRNKLVPGTKETWKLKIKNPAGDSTAAKAELLASMYDMSLDTFQKHEWIFDPGLSDIIRASQWETNRSFSVATSDIIFDDYDANIINNYSSPELNLFGLSLRNTYQPGSVTKSKLHTKIRFLPPVMKADEQIVAADDELHDVVVVKEESAGGVDYSLIESKKLQFAPPAVSNEKIIAVRKNRQETAFFFPDLVTDSNGELSVSFTVPEALTRWKFMAFAHTKNMFYESVEKEVVTQKQLMIQANAPRFLREGDTLYFTARISNLTDNIQSGTARLQLLDIQNNSSIDNLFGNTAQEQNFSLNKSESKALSWKLTVPYGSIQALTWRLTASTECCSDGEQGSLPILTNTQLVTESMPVAVNSHETKDFVFKKLEDASSPTLRHHRLTFEFTSNPVWYAVQALPYMMEYPYECSEQTFSRFFANSVASFLINSDPKIKDVFEKWKNSGNKDAFTSNLMKNQELKSILIQETPWLNDAQDETAAKERLALLFDLGKLSDEKTLILNKLRDAQFSEGGWPWFKEMPSSIYITQHIVAGFGHLDKLKIMDIRKDKKLFETLKRAIGYCDLEIYNRYKEHIAQKAIPAAQKIMPDGNLIIPPVIIHYLYARSYFNDVPLEDKYQEAFSYWQKLTDENWLSSNKYLQGMTALSAWHSGNKYLAKKIIRSLKENSITSDEMGMYFKSSNSWCWYEAPIETQSLMIEAFNEIAGDTSSVDQMRKWLLKQKQTSNWKTTRATAEACYALLINGTKWTRESKLPTVTIGDQNLEFSKDPIEAGTGYIKTSWEGSKVNSDMAKVHLENNNNTPAWGAMYWQYFEHLDKISQGNTSLTLKKQLFLEMDDKDSKKLIPVNEYTQIKPGDLLKVHIELKADRDMEYVHMKDMRASGLEPVNVLSEHKYQDGLWYYESTKDAATNFFFEYLRKGTYVFEYPLRVTYKGAFSNGITTIQCMYAPEFSAHSEGLRIKVNPDQKNLSFK